MRLRPRALRSAPCTKRRRRGGDEDAGGDGGKDVMKVQVTYSRSWVPRSALPRMTATRCLLSD